MGPGDLVTYKANKEQQLVELLAWARTAFAADSDWIVLHATASHLATPRAANDAKERATTVEVPHHLQDLYRTSGDCQDAQCAFCREHTGCRYESTGTRERLSFCSIPCLEAHHDKRLGVLDRLARGSSQVTQRPRSGNGARR